MEIPVYLRPSEGKKLFSFVFVLMAALFRLVLICCSHRLCCPAVIILLLHYKYHTLFVCLYLLL